GKSFAVKTFDPDHRGEVKKLQTLLDRGVQGERIVEVAEITDAFAVMELLPMNLTEFLRRDPPEELRLLLVEEVLLALKELHGFGVVHADIKPSNLMIEVQGPPNAPTDIRVKLIDFGLMAEMDLEALKLSFSRTVGVQGSFDYLSPERREKGHRPDPRDDLYAAGVVFFETLTGRPAHEAQVRRDEMPKIFRSFLGLASQRPENAQKALEEVWRHLAAKADAKKMQAWSRRLLKRRIEEFFGPKDQLPPRVEAYVAVAVLILMFPVGIFIGLVLLPHSDSEPSLDEPVESAPEDPQPQRTWPFQGSLRAEETAILRSLAWLQRHQDLDGKWACQHFSLRCSGTTCKNPGTSEAYSPGVTALTLLAFRSVGARPYEGRFEDTVQSALSYLLTQQNTEGRIGPETEDGRWIYNHALGTLAIVEYQRGKEAHLLKRKAQKAVDFLVMCRNPGSGWRYGRRPGESDTSVTAWAAIALATARDAGLRVPSSAVEGALAWFARVTDDASAFAGYRSLSDFKRPHQTGAFEKRTESMTAAALAARLFIKPDSKGSDLVEKAVGRLAGNPPRWGKEDAMDLVYGFFGTLALGAVGGPTWDAWKIKVREAILSRQIREGCADGSWDPVGPWGPGGGRVYATAINTLTLAVSFNVEAGSR
ncbi:MAG: protein kinase domain-containing protein, partial [Planctomycetota bacterium]